MSAPIKRYKYGYKDDGNGNRFLGLIDDPDGTVVLHTDHLASHAFDEEAEREAFEAEYPSQEFDGALGRDRFERHPERLDEYWYIGTRKAWFGWKACAKDRAKRAGGDA